MISGIRNLVSTHIGRSTDYSCLDDFASGGTSSGVVVGAGLGAAAGATIGAALGIHSMATDKVTIDTVRTEFTNPQLVGARYIPESCTTNFTYDDKGNLTGSYNTCSGDYFTPIIRENPTGLIEERNTFFHTNWLGPLSGALIGLGIGTVAGAIVGGLAGSLKNDELGEPARGVGNKSPLLGLAAGAAVGAAGGAFAGHVAQSVSQDLTQTVRTPVTVDTRIGWIPRSSDWSGLRNEATNYDVAISDPNRFQGKNEVVRPVPTGEWSEATVTTKSFTLTPLKGALYGAGVGAVAGGMAGVAVGVLQKHLQRD